MTCDTVVLGGLQPLTTIDYPGRLAAVLFAQGCNFRCCYCHNPELLPFAPASDRVGPTWAAALALLARRRGLLDGVVFSGGEATCQPGILAAMRAVHDLGFAVALHTNGSRPDVIAEMVREQLLDFVALDVKAPREMYLQITGRDAGTQVWETVDILAASGIDTEYRTTVHPEVLSDLSLLRMADALCARRVERFVVQQFRPGKTLDSTLADPGSDWIDPATVAGLASRFVRFEVRGEVPRVRVAGDHAVSRREARGGTVLTTRAA